MDAKGESGRGIGRLGSVPHILLIRCIKWITNENIV